MEEIGKMTEKEQLAISFNAIKEGRVLAVHKKS